jgi:hypothetical protein
MATHPITLQSSQAPPLSDGVMAMEAIATGLYFSCEERDIGERTAV